MAIKASEISDLIKARIEKFASASEERNIGTVVTVTDGIVRVHGLADAKYGEMLEFPGGSFGLALNRRLAVLPEVAAIYEELRAEVENIADVHITSAVALDEAQRTRLATALKKRLKREVRLHCAVDAGLIGGAVVRTGDFVIDGSLKARLERLATQIMH